MPAREAVSVVSRSHLPFVRVMAESLREHHREVRLTVVLVDDPDGVAAAGDAAAGDAGDITLSPLELGIEARELHRRALLYDTQGLISSLRPLAIRHVHGRGADSVLLLDADLLVLAPLDDLWELSHSRGVLLSPHVTRTLPDRDAIRREQDYLRAGTFNGGVLGVGREAMEFLDWMEARVRRDCVRDLSRGLLYSQTWLNLVPALFEHHVLRDPGVNVTAHRLAGRDLEGTREAPQLDGAPVRLLHFTGFDPGAPDVLCRYLPGAQHLLTHRPLMRALCADYADRLGRAGWPASAGRPWDRLACGIPVEDAISGTYGGALLAAEQGLAQEPPDPFDPTDAAAFLRWLSEAPSELPRYLAALWARRPDLRTEFPDALGSGAPGLLAWWRDRLEEAGASDAQVSPELLQRLAAGPDAEDQPAVVRRRPSLRLLPRRP